MTQSRSSVSTLGAGSCAFFLSKDVVEIAEYHHELSCGAGLMKWDSSRRFEPVVLVFGEKKDRAVVRTARDAAELLLRYWPVDDGEQFYDAIKICLDVIIGLTEPDRLREAMIRAAAETGIVAIAVVQRSL